MALIFGPILAIVFIPLFALLGVSSHIFWIVAVAVGGVVIKGADLLGYRLGLSSQQYSGPVAFSTLVCAILLITILVRIYL